MPNKTGSLAPSPSRPRSYFFVSYAHFTPLEGSKEAEPDPNINKFFGDLAKAVGERKPPKSGYVAGFFDRSIPPGYDLNTSLSRALGQTEVFVPLYSPGYLASSWSGKELASFQSRLTAAGLPKSADQIAPVLWAPVREDNGLLDIDQALAIGGAEPEYQKKGLLGLLMTQSLEVYGNVVEELAEHIVAMVEHSPLKPTVALNISEATSAFQPQQPLASFAVTVAAPTTSALPAGVSPDNYTQAGTGWRPFPELMVPLAEHTRRVAERLDFAVELSVLGSGNRPVTDGPGIILIDPWFIASASGENGQVYDEERLATLQAAVSNLPAWVLPLVISSPSGSERVKELAGRVRDILAAAKGPPTESSRRAARGVSSLKDFVSRVPVLVAEAERQYLRRSRLVTGGHSEPRPRLTGTDKSA